MPHPDDYGKQFATVTEVYERVDVAFDTLDAKITKVADKQEAARIQQAADLAKTREEMVGNFASLKAWIKYWPVAAVVLGTVGGEQIAQALIR